MEKTAMGEVLPSIDSNNLIEAISKKEFWFKIAAEPRFKPEEYWSISRI